MSFFSSPPVHRPSLPLSVRIGADDAKVSLLSPQIIALVTAMQKDREHAASILLSACSILQEDATGVSGPPHSFSRLENVKDGYKSFSPKCVAWVAQPTLTIMSGGVLETFQALDATGQWWVGQWGVFDGAIRTSGEPGSDDRSWFQKAVDAVGTAIVDYGIPVLVATLSVAVPGSVLVLAAGGAILAWRNLAHGESLTDAVIDAQRQQFAKSPTAFDAYDKGIAMVQSGAAESAILNYAQKTLYDAESKKVFLLAVQLGKAQSTQTLVVSAMVYWLGPNDGAVLLEAIKYGAKVEDAVFGLRGVPGQTLLASISSQAAALVDTNKETPSKLSQIALETPYHFTFAVAMSGGASGATASGAASAASGSSSGSGVGTVAVASGVAFVGYKFLLPAIKAWWTARSVLK